MLVGNRPAGGYEIHSNRIYGLEKAYPDVHDFFGMSQEQKGKKVIYPSIEEFQRAYIGIIPSLAFGDWAAGAAFEDLVLATSPENPGSQHSYDDILQILVHEYVHALIYRINETPNVWLDEGLATYLAGQKSYLPQILPGFEVFQKDDLGVFLDHDGYAIGESFLAYLDAVYGNENINQLIKTNDYEATFGKSATEIYSEWTLSLETGK